MKFIEGTTVCISVQALYERFGKLLFCKIYPDFVQIKSDYEYFDLYNDDGECACMDGEEVTIEQVGEHLITFRNDNGESSVHFTLTVDEAEIAICT